MTMKEVLKDACLFVGKPELYALRVFTEGGAEPTIDQQSDIDLLVRCFNLVYREIAANFVPLLHKQKVTFTDGRLELEALEKPLTYIKSLRTAGGKAVTYQIFPTHIEADTYSAVLTYAYLPEAVGLNDEVNLFAGQVLPEVVAYGVAREFEFLNGDFADADMWETRFKNALALVHSKKQTKILPKN